MSAREAMRLHLAGVMVRSRWTLQYQWLALPRGDRWLLLAGLVIVIASMVIRQQLIGERQALQQQLHEVAQPSTPAAIVAGKGTPDLMSRFQQFLPERETQAALRSDIHQRAERLGLTLQRITLKSAPCAVSSVCWQHGFGISLSGTREAAERFLLELLRAYPSLVIESQSIQGDPQDPSRYSVDYELDYLSRPL